MTYNWKITYLDNSGRIVSETFYGSLYDITCYTPPNGSNTSILKIEKIAEN